MDSQNYIKVFENKNGQITLVIGKSNDEKPLDLYFEMICIPYEDLEFIVNQLQSHLDWYHSINEDYDEAVKLELFKAKALKQTKDGTDDERLD